MHEPFFFLSPLSGNFLAKLFLIRSAELDLLLYLNAIGPIKILQAERKPLAGQRMLSVHVCVDV